MAKFSCEYPGGYSWGYSSGNSCEYPDEHPVVSFDCQQHNPNPVPLGTPKSQSMLAVLLK